MRELASELSELDHLSFESGQLGRYLSGTAGEAELATAFVLPELRRLAQAVKDGHAAIPHRPHDPEPAEAIEQAPLMTVFMWKSARFRDHAGVIRIARQATWVEPTFVADVEYRDITSEGLLRASSFKGLFRK
ncbi:hypothetical protein CP49_01580 [Bradyrhizobium valentinum]|uniref:DNA ligase (ATP) n=1 Tax=Bradyrhizobium valentinum TaxID=1518501 RepID=A0A0R3LG91_9BRAD|nr:hypothetical protein CP49_01580 [Bradyrhizobium valentinum]